MEIWNDDDPHFFRFGRFEPVLKAWKRSLQKPAMRHFAHVYRNNIPARLDNSRDRTREYPTGR